MPTPTAQPDQEMTVRLDSVADLLATIRTLPADERAAATARIEDALELPAPAARMALGLLALDLAGRATDAAAAQRQPHKVIVLPDATPVAASA